MRHIPKQIFGQLPLTIRRLAPAPAAAEARTKNPRPDKHTEAAHIRELAYLHAVVALAAKLAATDTPANDAERKELFSIFAIKKTEETRDLFEEALKDKISHLHYAGRLKTFFQHEKTRLEQVLDNLFTFALADGPAHPEEMVWLFEVGVEMGMNPRLLMAKMQMAVIGESASPQAVLRIRPRAKQEQIKLAYRQAIATAHPDKVLVKNKAVRDMYAERFKQVQEAYDTLKRHAAKR